MVNGIVPVGTKRCVPRLSPLLVPRPRLEALLDHGARRQVTLVCGPPGSGKTTLVASTLDPLAAARSVAWLGLDARDNDTDRLTSLLCAALRDAAHAYRDGGGTRVAPGRRAPAGRNGSSAGAGTPAGAGAGTHTGGRAPTDRLDEVFGRLARHGDRRILVVDDVHELRSSEALEVIAHLVGHAPRLLDVVLVGRADPAVSLERLQLDGRLGEIRNPELAFTTAETAALLDAHGVRLAHDDVKVLRQRTEGWAAGLRIAATALQSERDPGRYVRNAGHGQAAVCDYLLRELLVHEDDDGRRFLLHTSVADHLTADLAELLTGDPRSGERLDELERSGVLVAEPDGGRRYHSLFGTLLRARLARHEPDLARDLHQQAAVWYLDHEMSHDARSQALAAGDWHLLGRLMAWRWIDATLDGQDVADATAVAELPSGVATRSPGLALVAAAGACHRSNREDADLYREALDALLPPASPGGWGVGDLDETAVDRLTSWHSERLVLDADYGCAFGSDTRAVTASAALGKVPATDPAAAGLRRLGALRRAELALDAGDLEQAAGQLADLADQDGAGWFTIEAAGFLALLEAASGRLGAADARIAAVAADGRKCATPQATTAAHLADLLRLVQRGERRSALLGAAEPSPAGHHASRALHLVDRVARAGLASTPTMSVGVDEAVVHHRLGERALIALGVIEVVTPDGAVHALGGPGERAVAEGRCRLTAGDTAGCDEAIALWLAAGTRTGHPRTLVEALALRAVAASYRGEHIETRHHLSEALDLSGGNGIVGPLLHHGAAVARLLERNLSEMDTHMRSALGLLERIRPTGAGNLLEPLTDREMEVLVHLPTLMSNAEIADGLHLSVNTVKTHLKAVYRKLGVEGRRQAVARGRELQLLG
jgi:LuxR family maltose regulon positive regulatory protein